MCNYSQATLSAERIARIARIAAGSDQKNNIRSIAHECESMHNAVRDASEDYADERLISRCSRVASLIDGLDSISAQACAVLRATVSAAIRRATARALSIECAE